MTTPTRGHRRSLRSRLLGFITDAAGRLTAAWSLLAGAQRRLLAALARIRPGTGAPAAIRQASAAFLGALGDFNRDVTAFAERWAAQDLPLAYRAGGLNALTNAGRPRQRWEWTRRHQETITGLAATYYADLMARLAEALRRARAFLRAAQDQARTPRGVDTDALLDEHPLHTVIYANEARHPVHAWAESALSWQAVSTANTGAARTALHDLGCQWLEVYDGLGCGWRDHGDPDPADGTLRTVADALAHPLAHPRCVREFYPRLDVTGYTALGDAP